MDEQRAPQQAMILAAGFGKRLGAITLRTPKPLIQINGLRLIEYHLHALARAHYQRVVINVAYFSNKMMDTLGDGSRYGLEIIYSVEDNGPIGVGAGIQQALPHFHQQPFLLIAADIWCQIDYAQLSKADSSQAHCLLVDNPAFYHQGDFSLIDNNRLCAASAPSYTYAGIAIMEPALWDQPYPSGAFSLQQPLQRAIQQQSATGEIHRGPWFNVGSAHQLKALKQFLAST